MNNEIIEKIQKLKGRTAIYWDMDGTLTELRWSGYVDFAEKRPLTPILESARILSNNPNITSFVLSRLPNENKHPFWLFDESEKHKNIWLDKFAPFIKQENRVYTKTCGESGEMQLANFTDKMEFFKKLLETQKEYDNIIFVDDDARQLASCSELCKEFPKLMLIYSSEFVG